jgi:hypothetical protein
MQQTSSLTQPFVTGHHIFLSELKMDSIFQVGNKCLKCQITVIFVCISENGETESNKNDKAMAHCMAYTNFFILECEGHTVIMIPDRRERSKIIIVLIRLSASNFLTRQTEGSNSLSLSI